MTYEQAMHFKLLLINAYSAELAEYVDRALDAQEPLEDVILELISCGGDSKKQLAVLNSFLLNAAESEIDYDEVFSLMLAFLRRLYENGMPIEKLLELMSRVAWDIGKYCDEPWWTMYLMDEVYSEALYRKESKEKFMDDFRDFLYNGTPLIPYSETHGVKKSWFSRLFRRKK